MSYSTINSSEQLDEVILQLTAKSKLQQQELRFHFDQALETIKPANLIKSTVSDLTHSPGFLKTAITGGLAVGAGLLSKKLIVGRSGGFLKSLAGMAATFALKKTIAKNSNKITATGVNLLKKMTNKA